MGQKESKRAIIYTGGEATPVLLPKPEVGDVVIAADSGLDLARRCHTEERVDFFLGDMDSVKNKNGIRGLQTSVVPCEKDYTDTMLAVDTALDLGCREILVLGGLGGRFDHSLSNLFLLEYIHSRMADGILTDGMNRVRYTDSAITLYPEGFKYFSLIAIETCHGVCIDGGKYPLVNAALTRQRQYAVSNEIAEGAESARIFLRSGALFVLECRA